jgi:hypothetical protein
MKNVIAAAAIAAALLICNAATAFAEPTEPTVASTAEQNAGRDSEPPDCEGSFEPYDYTPAALEACGIPVFPATVEALPGGGERYSYYEPTGTLFEETTVPPPGFDPVGATAEELAEYGFPPRPTPLASPGEQAEWERTVSLRNRSRSGK